MCFSKIIDSPLERRRSGFVCPHPKPLPISTRRGGAMDAPRAAREDASGRMVLARNAGTQQTPFSAKFV